MFRINCQGSSPFGPKRTFPFKKFPFEVYKFLFKKFPFEVYKFPFKKFRFEVYKYPFKKFRFEVYKYPFQRSAWHQITIPDAKIKINCPEVKFFLISKHHFINFSNVCKSE